MQVYCHKFYMKILDVFGLGKHAFPKLEIQEMLQERFYGIKIYCKA